MAARLMLSLPWCRPHFFYHVNCVVIMLINPNYMIKGVRSIMASSSTSTSTLLPCNGQVIEFTTLDNKLNNAHILIGSLLWSIRGQTHSWGQHKKLIILYCIKQIDSMLPCVCSVIDHRQRQNVVRLSVIHSAIASCATFLSLPHFDVLLNWTNAR